MWKLVVWSLTGLLFGFLVSGTVNILLVSRGGIQPFPKKVKTVEQVEKTSGQPVSYKPVSDFFLIEESGSSSAQESSHRNQVTLAETETVESTELPLELVGTLAGAKSYSRAVFRSLDPRKTFTLEPGEEWGEFKLLAVESDRVKILNFKKDQEEYLTIARSAKSSLEDKKKKSGVEKVSRYRINQAIHSNINNLLATVDAGPELRNGKIIGFRLKHLNGKPGKLLKKLGFQKDDIITRVNGQKVNSVEKALSLWSQLRNKKEFVIRVLRDGKKQKLSYRLTR